MRRNVTIWNSYDGANMGTWKEHFEMKIPFKFIQCAYLNSASRFFCCCEREKRRNEDARKFKRIRDEKLHGKWESKIKILFLCYRQHANARVSRERECFEWSARTFHNVKWTNDIHFEITELFFQSPFVSFVGLKLIFRIASPHSKMMAKSERKKHKRKSAGKLFRENKYFQLSCALHSASNLRHLIPFHRFFIVSLFSCIGFWIDKQKLQENWENENPGQSIMETTNRWELGKIKRRIEFRIVWQ